MQNKTGLGIAPGPVFENSQSFFPSPSLINIATGSNLADKVSSDRIITVWQSHHAFTRAIT